MKTAQKIKLISTLFLVWALPLSMLPRVVARPLAPADINSPDKKPDTAAAKVTASENYAKLPLRFEANVGQSAKSVKYLTGGSGYTVFLTSNEAVFSLRSETKKTSRSVLRMKMIGANQTAKVEGQQPLQGKVNYLMGNDRSKWHTDIETFREVHYSDVWPGVDMVWYGTQNKLEYDFVIKPDSTASAIRLMFKGADKLRIDEHGNLLLTVGSEEMVQSAPTIYQEHEQGRVNISGKYVIKGKNEVGFEVGAYDVNKPLIIDPILTYSTYIGGESTDVGLGVTADSQGRAYLAGISSSDETFFPIENAFQGVQIDTLGFVTKLNATGDDVLYSTYLGDSNTFCVGNICGTEVRAIAVTTDGRAVVTGAVTNEDNDSKFPVTETAYQKNGFCISWCGLEPNRMVDAFVTVFKADGSVSIIQLSLAGGLITGIASAALTSAIRSRSMLPIESI